MGKKYIGLDAHKTSSTMAVIDEKGGLISRTVMRTSQSELVSAVGAIQGPKELTFEEGSMSNWLYMILHPLVDRLVVCNPAENKKLIDKSDELDAFHLANLLRGGFLKSVYHKAHPMEDLQSCLKTYLQVTEDLVRTKNRLKALFNSRGVFTGPEVYGPEAREACMDRLDRGFDVQRSRYLFGQLDFLQWQKEQLKQELITKAKKHPGYRLLRSLPGFGPIQAAKVLAIVVTPHRFRTKRQFWRYCGLAVVKHTSSDWIEGKNGLEPRRKERTLGLNRNRHPVMKHVFKHAAGTASATSACSGFYQSLLDKGQRPEIAKVTMARKLATISLTIWKKGVLFDPAYLS